MLKITVTINDRVIATAVGGDRSDFLRGIAGYPVRTEEIEDSALKFKHTKTLGLIEQHSRRGSIWHLVRKICDVALDPENKVN